MDNQEALLKPCSKCKITKPATEFYTRRGTKLHSWCKPCNKRPKQERLAYSRMYLYGLTVEQVALMVAQQNGRCAICTEIPVARARHTDPWHVDHCHTSGRVRGLLCWSCNMAIGFLKDNAAVLRRAADYLEVEQQNTNTEAD